MPLSLISDDLINRIGVLASQRQPPVHDVHDQPFGVGPRPGGVATPRYETKADELQRILLRAYVGMNQAVEVHSQYMVIVCAIGSGFTVRYDDPRLPAGCGEILSELSSQLNSGLSAIIIARKEYLRVARRAAAGLRLKLTRNKTGFTGQLNPHPRTTTTTKKKPRTSRSGARAGKAARVRDRGDVERRAERR